jgi:hypothetical protein
MSGFDVVKQFGTAALATLPKRLKCALCGAREAKLTALSPPPPRN